MPLMGPPQVQRSRGYPAYTGVVRSGGLGVPRATGMGRCIDEGLAAAPASIRLRAPASSRLHGDGNWAA